VVLAGRSYDEVFGRFRWQIPAQYNIGVDVCDRQAADARALIYRRADGSVEEYSFGQLKKLSNKLANVFEGHGLLPGDRVGVLLPQALETAVAHIAAYKAGLVAVPLFTLFGVDALGYRLRDSGAAAIVTDGEGAARIASLRAQLPKLKLVLSIDGAGPGAGDFDTAMGRASDQYRPAATGPDDPALIIYTSGTTGPPKGALHGHRVLLGHLPGVVFPHNFFPQPGDLFWTPADWAWIGGLYDVLLPAWHYGVPVLAYRAAKFDPEEAFSLMADMGVRNSFLPPTALKLMRQVPDPGRWGLDLRSVGSGGEPLGQGLLDWGREALGVTINEFYGQTECNLVVGNCAEAMAVKPGAMGRAIPGHEVAVVDENGAVLAPGTLGNIAVRRPDPVMFLEYWNQPDATAEKFRGDWMLTGDQGRQDEEGYFWFVGRDDDVITTAGYRVGPGEVEDCLAKHPAVALAAVVGLPDPVRTERVTAFVVLKGDQTASEALATEIQSFVKTRLAAHAYPREVRFVDSLPITATGKIRRRDLRQGAMPERPA